MKPFKKEFYNSFKDTHRENAPSNKTPGHTKICWYTKSTFIRGSYTETKF